MSFNDQIIDEFRANNGVTRMFGSDLVLLHTVGAKSGEPRVSPVTSLRDGEDWLVIASAAGSPKHPAWYFNLVAQPLVSVETAEGEFDVLATTLSGVERETAWQGFVARSSAFEEYVTRAEGREFPIVRLSRR
jgi:deazaflavin-dependent oxidoreductase (nitroreductase family)